MRRTSAGQTSVGHVRLLIPALAIFVVLMGGPLLLLADESLRTYTPGHVGAAEHAPLTFSHYAALATRTYVAFFVDTFWLSVIAAGLSLLVGFPIAYRISHGASQLFRRAWFILLLSLVLLSVLVRTYAIALLAGPPGFGRFFSSLLGLGVNSRAYAELTVVAGLLHCTIPIAILTLLAPIRALNPRLIDAAEALGASRSWAHLSITLPLATRAITTTFVVTCSFCVSAFVIPMVLGKGRVLFVANLVYSRFSEVGDFPDGAALAIALLAITLLLTAAIGHAASRA